MILYTRHTCPVSGITTQRPLMTISLSGLAKRLVTDGLLSEAQAEESLRAARRDKIPFVTHLVKNQVAEGRHIAMAASQEFGSPLLDLNAFDLANCPRDLIDPKLLRKHRMLPLLGIQYCGCWAAQPQVRDSQPCLLLLLLFMLCHACCGCAVVWCALACKRSGAGQGRAGPRRWQG